MLDELTILGDQIMMGNQQDFLSTEQRELEEMCLINVKLPIVAKA